MDAEPVGHPHGARALLAADTRRKLLACWGLPSEVYGQLVLSAATC